MKAVYTAPEWKYRDLIRMCDIICDSLTDSGTGEEDDYGGSVSGGGGAGSW